MRIKLPIKAFDFFIILLALFLTGFSFYRVYANPQSSLQVLIEGQNQKWIYPLGAEESIKINGPLGFTLIRLKGKEAWVESSPCKNQLCVAAGILRGCGDFAACLPNRVIIAIEGYEADREIDAHVW